MSMSPVRTRQHTQKSQYFEKQSDSDASATNSGDEFLPAPKSVSKNRNVARKSKVSRSSVEFTNTVSKNTKKPVMRLQKMDNSHADALKKMPDFSDSTDEDEFEEISGPLSDDETKVTISTQNEIEFMSQLLTKSEAELTQVKEERKEIEISVSTLKTKSTSRSPEVLAALAEARKIRQKTRSIHVLHVIGFLTLGRFINRVCDDPLIRALGLSLTKELKSWDVAAIRSLVLTFTSLIGPKLESKIPDIKEGIQARLIEGCPSADDCSILMVAALRALGFDTRLVLAFAPPPLRPSIAKPIKTLKPFKAKRNNKIVSSDSEDETQINSGYTFFAEVFLPCDQLWYSLDLSSPVGKVTSEFSSAPFHYPYVVGFASTENSYIGRSPINLAPRYDPTWMSTSKANRIPDTQYEHFLSTMKYLCDGDVAKLRQTNSAKPEERRDSADVERTFDHLRSLPMPNRVQDLKNHPLYVLRRHLLKFEVIFPDDAPVVGFLKVGAKGNETTEPIYPRECVHLCHTRESWLKEAKVVRVGEKPAKIVKAMMTVKRKLLQEQNGAIPTVELFGPWQVDSYVPPVAENGIVPRNEHGNVELFKSCMLPIGCVHIKLPGIQHIAKRLQIDIAPAMVGWSFHKAGWAHPEYDGFVVCREMLPGLIDAWRTARMNAVAVEAADRAERALANWKRLTKHLLLWKRVEERFQLAKSAHVKSQLVSIADLKTTLSSKPGEPSSSDWKPLTSEKAVFPRLLDVNDLINSQPKFRPKRVYSKTQSKNSPKRSRKRKRRRPSTEPEDGSDDSDHNDFILSESD